MPSPKKPKTTRYCPGCNTVKPVTEFFRNRSSSTGYQSTCKPCRQEKVLDWKRRLTPEQRAKYNKKYGLSVHYKLTLDERDAMEVAQKSKCASCGRKERLVVDHDHKTKRVRALLCHHCNLALGMLMEDLDRIEKLRQYVLNYCSN